MSRQCRVCHEPGRLKSSLCPSCLDAKTVIQKAAATMMSLYGIPKAHGLCVDCGSKPAEHREHRRYSLPLAVDYVCGGCNAKRGPAEDLDELIMAHRGLKANEVQTEPVRLDLDAELRNLELALLKKALTSCNGNRTKAAKMLCISFRTMRYRMQSHGM